MTEYLKSSFSVGLGSPEFRDGWEAVFGAKRRVKTALTGIPKAALKALLEGREPGTISETSKYLSETYAQEDLVSVYEYMLDYLETLPQGDDLDYMVDRLDYVWLALTPESIQKVNSK